MERRQAIDRLTEMGDFLPAGPIKKTATRDPIVLMLCEKRWKGELDFSILVNYADARKDPKGTARDILVELVQRFGDEMGVGEHT